MFFTWISHPSTSSPSPQQQQHLKKICEQKKRQTKGEEKMWVAQHYRFLMLSALLCYAAEFQVHKKMGSEKKVSTTKKEEIFSLFFHTSMTQNVRIFKKFSHIHVHTEICLNFNLLFYLLFFSLFSRLPVR